MYTYVYIYIYIYLCNVKDMVGSFHEYSNIKFISC